MKHRIKFRFVSSFLFLIFSFLSNSFLAHSQTFLVTQVADGDTVTLQVEKDKVERVRLVGIDAPEKAQRFGSESTERLKTIVLGKVVELQSVGRDKYGRILGDLYLHFGKEVVHVNYEQLNSGLAWYYRQYASSLPPERQALYDKTEIEVKSERSGLWVDPNPVPPWVYRQNPKQEETR